MKNKIKIGLIVTTIIMLGGGLVHSFMYPEASGSTMSTYFAAIFCLILAFLDEVSSIKGMGIEVKTKELESKIDEADKIIKKIHELSIALSSPILRIVSRLGRWGTSYSVSERLDIKKRIFRILDDANVPENEIRILEQEFNKYILIDMVSKVKTTVEHAVNTKKKENKSATETIPDIEMMSREITDLFQKEQVVNIHESLIPAIEKSSLFNQNEKDNLIREISNYIKDIKEFLETGEVLNPNLWEKQ
ncbi:MAG: hypothetical protein HQL07_01575 [Nitrospirae bacterium]|nr:hypothetical protein [Magnetococcales bacterium]